MSGGPRFAFVHQQALSGYQMGQVGPELALEKLIKGAVFLVSSIPGGTAR